MENLDKNMNNVVNAIIDDCCGAYTSKSYLSEGFLPPELLRRINKAINHNSKREDRRAQVQMPSLLDYNYFINYDHYYNFKVSRLPKLINHNLNIERLIAEVRILSFNYDFSIVRKILVASSGKPINTNYFVSKSYHTLSDLENESSNCIINYNKFKDIYDKNQYSYIKNIIIPLDTFMIINSCNSLYNSIDFGKALSSCRKTNSCCSQQSYSNIYAIADISMTFNDDCESITSKLNEHVQRSDYISLSTEVLSINLKLTSICIESKITTNDIQYFLDIETHPDYHRDFNLVDLINSARGIKSFILKRKCPCNVCFMPSYENFKPMFSVIISVYKPKNTLEFCNSFIRDINLDLLSSLLIVSVDYISRSRGIYNFPSESNILRSYSLHLSMTTLITNKEIEMRCLRLKRSMNKTSINHKILSSPRETMINILSNSNISENFPDYPIEVFIELGIDISELEEVKEEINEKLLEHGNKDRNELECKICFTSKSVSHEVLQCKHLICKTCMISYVNSELDNSIVNIICPICKTENSHDLKLTNEIPEHTLSKLLDKDDIIRLHKKSIEIGTANKNFRSCSKPDCSMTIELMRGNFDFGYWACDVCKTLNCSKCKISHQYIYGKPCPVNAMNDKTNCPWCSVAIHKFEGCNHISCRCGKHFCYKCGKGYQDEGASKRASCSCPLIDLAYSSGLS